MEGGGGGGGRGKKQKKKKRGGGGGGGVGDGKRSNIPLIKGQWMKADSQNCQRSNQQVTDNNG